MNTNIIIVGGVIGLVLVIVIVVVVMMMSKKTTTSNVTLPPVIGKVEDSSKLISDFQPSVNANFAWETIPSTKDKDLNNLSFTTKCSKPWYAYYQIGCKLNNNTVYSDRFGPVYKDNWQGPNIRIDKASRDHTCFKIGGELSVLRKRPSDNDMIDITSNLTNNDRTGPYNGRDSVFTDNYKIDCDILN